jgi:hypothetical protein
MTENPAWALRLQNGGDRVREHSEKHGIKGAVRITPNDIREGAECTHMWTKTLGKYDEDLEAARNGRDFLAIESVGAKRFTMKPSCIAT